MEKHVGGTGGGTSGGNRWGERVGGLRGGLRGAWPPGALILYLGKLKM